MKTVVLSVIISISLASSILAGATDSRLANSQISSFSVIHKADPPFPHPGDPYPPAIAQVTAQADPPFPHPGDPYPPAIARAI
jgi:hypothetical protein